MILADPILFPCKYGVLAGSAHKSDGVFAKNFQLKYPTCSEVFPVSSLANLDVGEEIKLILKNGEFQSPKRNSLSK